MAASDATNTKDRPNDEAGAVGCAGAPVSTLVVYGEKSADGAVSVAKNGRKRGELTMSEFEHNRLVDMYLTVWWVRTRRAVTHRFLARADVLLELLREVNDFNEDLVDRIDAEIWNVLTQAIGRPWASHMRPRQRALWEAAQDVCPNRAKLSQELRSDKAVRGLKPDVAADKALGQLLITHLDGRRRELFEITEHESRVWTKLVELSSDLIHQYVKKHGRFPPPGYRCSAVHFKEVQARIKDDRPDDQRICNIKLVTIKQYFQAFCSECSKLSLLDYRQLLSDEPWSDSATYVPPGPKEEMYRRLEECINRLDKPMRDVIHATYFPDREVDREALVEAEFNQLLKTAKRQLSICMRDGDPEKMR